MGVLGKDLLDFHRPRTNTKVEFGASGYWVESNPAMQPYGAVLMEILNLDATPLQESLDQYRNAVAEKPRHQRLPALLARILQRPDCLNLAHRLHHRPIRRAVFHRQPDDAGQRGHGQKQLESFHRIFSKMRSFSPIIADIISVEQKKRLKAASAC